MKPLIYDKDLNEIQKIIDSNGNINQKKKVKLGEVFTPFNLILEMMNKIPKSVWTNPNNTWLDPGSGIGNFSMLVYYYLDNGLKKWQPNNEKRRTHIIKNMIYMVEISQTNVNKCKKIFGENVNISKSDFLNENGKWKSEFKVSEFNIILGNPPYNVNGMKGKGRSDKGATVIWGKFVDYSLDLLKPNGYCLFFTPNSWTELKSQLAKKILSKQIILIKNFDVVNAYKLFDKKAGSLPLCYYLIKNSKPSKSTLIHDNVFDKLIEFDIIKHMIIPNKNINLIKKILSKNKDSLEKYYKFTPAKEKKDSDMYSSMYSQKYSYPLINYVHKKMHISFAKNCSVVQNNTPKLILPNYSMGYPILDPNGLLDVGGRVSYYIEIPNNNIEQLKKIQKFFMTDLALTIINSLKTAQKFLSTRTFSVFPDVTKMNISINDESLAKYYNLNTEDKKSILNQKQQGEGNLSNTQKEYLLSFSLYDNLTNNQKDNIIKKTKKCKVKEKKSTRNNSTRKIK
tara:strand:+ start:105 stop:1634 length:1530 start_codon:yes stop_codon:yes gene_type:complete